jgi:hypothetical protein
MNRSAVLLLSLLIAGAMRPSRTSAADTAADTKVTCDTCPISSIQPKASRAFAPADSSHGCKTQTKREFPVPDPKCTPGAVNPSVTLQVLKNTAFRTGCVRDCAPSAPEKSTTYGSYGLPHPANNDGSSETCELDHLVPLELGGADTLDNIWPQCGPSGVVLAKRYFKQKDMVEDFLAEQVKSGQRDLSKTQASIASDWPQFLSDATEFCSKNPEKCKSGE